MSQKHPDVDILPQDIDEEFDDQLNENINNNQDRNQMPMNMDEDEGTQIRRIFYFLIYDFFWKYWFLICKNYSNLYPVYNQNNFDEIYKESPIERIKRNALQFIISIRENCKISQNSIGVIIDGIQSLHCYDNCKYSICNNL